MANSYLERPEPEDVVFNRHDIDFYRDSFETIMDEARNSTDQFAIEAEMKGRLRMATFLIMLFSGLLFAAIALLCIHENKAWCLIPLALCIIPFRDAVQAFNDVISLARQQDRRYFLTCLRASKSITELSDIGFFSYQSKTKRKGDELKQVDKLMKALSTNKNHFEIFPPPQ